MKNIFKFIFAIFLIPFIFLAGVKSFDMLFKVCLTSEIVWFFVGGAAGYAAVHFFLYDFARPYVLAHECAHALCALFFGYSVHEMKVKENSGHVKLSDHNTAVVLAPYVIPVYFLLLAAAVFVCYKLGYIEARWQNYISLALGFVWAHHIVHTLTAITETSQPDLKVAGGTVFSVVIIILLNLFFVLLLAAMLFPEEISLWPAFKETLFNTISLWQKLLKYIVDLVINIFKL